MYYDISNNLKYSYPAPYSCISLHVLSYSLQPDLSMSLQEYIKIPLSGLPEFIIRFSLAIDFNCKPLADIGNAIKAADTTADKSIYNAIWPDEVTQFCNTKADHKLYGKFSIGFKGKTIRKAEKVDA